MQTFSRRGATRLMAMLLCLTMLFSGCTIGSDTSWVYRQGDVVMPAGVYLTCQISAISDAYAIHGDSAISTAELFKQTIEGEPATQWVEKRTASYAKRYFLVEQRFNDMGLVYDEILAATAEYTVESTWAQFSPTYTKNDIAKASLAKAIENSTKLQEIFSAIYGEGGERAVSEDVLIEEYQKTYLNVNAFSIPKFASVPETTEKTIDELNAEMKVLADTSLARLESGDKIETLAFEVEKAQAEIFGDDPATVEIYPEGSLHIFIPAAYSAYYEPELLEAIAATENDAYAMIETEFAFYVFKKLDATADGGFDYYRETVLFDLKMDEFSNELLAEADALSVDVNSAAVRTYKPSKIDMTVSAA